MYIYIVPAVHVLDHKNLFRTNKKYLIPKSSLHLFQVCMCMQVFSIAPGKDILTECTVMGGRVPCADFPPHRDSVNLLQGKAVRRSEKELLIELVRRTASLYKYNVGRI